MSTRLLAIAPGQGIGHAGAVQLRGRRAYVAASSARIAELRREPLRRPRDPVGTCPILNRLSSAPQEPTRPGARISAVLLLLLLLL